MLNRIEISRYCKELKITINESWDDSKFFTDKFLRLIYRKLIYSIFNNQSRNIKMCIGLIEYLRDLSVKDLQVLGKLQAVTEIAELSLNYVNDSDLQDEIDDIEPCEYILALLYDHGSLSYEEIIMSLGKKLEYSDLDEILDKLQSYDIISASYEGNEYNYSLTYLGRKQLNKMRPAWIEYSADILKGLFNSLEEPKTISQITQEINYKQNDKAYQYAVELYLEVLCESKVVKFKEDTIKNEKYFFYNIGEKRVRQDRSRMQYVYIINDPRENLDIRNKDNFYAMLSSDGIVKPTGNYTISQLLDSFGYEKAGMKKGLQRNKICNMEERYERLCK